MGSAQFSLRPWAQSMHRDKQPTGVASMYPDTILRGPRLCPAHSSPSRRTCSRRLQSCVSLLEYVDIAAYTPTPSPRSSGSWTASVLRGGRERRRGSARSRRCKLEDSADLWRLPSRASSVGLDLWSDTTDPGALGRIRSCAAQCRREPVLTAPLCGPSSSPPSSLMADATVPASGGRRSMGGQPRSGLPSPSFSLAGARNLLADARIRCGDGPAAVPAGPVIRSRIRGHRGIRPWIQRSSTTSSPASCSASLSGKPPQRRRARCVNGSVRAGGGHVRQQGAAAIRRCWNREAGATRPAWLGCRARRSASPVHNT
jgi:hypothetical protein